MDFLDLVTEVIDLRSFSNLWYWIVLAILWSSFTHWVLGIPYHLVQRARGGDADSARDLRLLARINSRRVLEVADMSGPLVVALGAFVISALAVLGWGYRIEFAQALVLLILPLVLVAGLSVVTARRLHDSDFATAEALLRHHRLIVQAMGIVSIFLTAFWGMKMNVTASVLH